MLIEITQLLYRHGSGLLLIRAPILGLRPLFYFDKIQKSPRAQNPIEGSELVGPPTHGLFYTKLHQS